MWKLLLVVAALSANNGLSLGRLAQNYRGVPPTCSHIECPTYTSTYFGRTYEIRHYDSIVWMSTSPLQNISFVGATRDGFMKLFDYIQGKNRYSDKIEMTAPVITEVFPSDGPLCESNFTVSFYVPKANQADPPPAEGLHVQTWENLNVAVRTFSGFASDYDIAVEAAELQASLAGTKWGRTIEKREGASAAYVVAQYNSPFQYFNRVNEIWMLCDTAEEAEM